MPNAVAYSARRTSTERYHLGIRGSDFGLEAASLPVCSRETLFGLRELIAETRSGRDRIENRNPSLFLLTLNLSETGCCCCGVLLTQCKVRLRGSQIGRGGFEDLTIRLSLGFERC